jgi:hypothetical protein
MQEAKNLHGDITKLLLDIELLQKNNQTEQPTEIEVDGGTW